MILIQIVTVLETDRYLRLFGLFVFRLRNINGQNDEIFISFTFILTNSFILREKYHWMDPANPCAGCKWFWNWYFWNDDSKLLHKICNFIFKTWNVIYNLNLSYCQIIFRNIHNFHLFENNWIHSRFKVSQWTGMKCPYWVSRSTHVSVSSLLFGLSEYV